MADHRTPEIGRRLTASRATTGLNQSEYAERAGIAQNTYNQYETGAKRPTVDNAILLCDTYGLTLDWIYRGESSGLSYKLWDAIQRSMQS